MSARTSPVPTLPQLAPEDEVVVHKLANQLWGLEIASRDECLKIAMDLFNAGCPSLESLLECPSINTIQELQTELGTLKNVELNPIQLRKIVKWIQRQSHTLVHDSDVGSKRLHPSNSLPPVASQHVRRLEASDASSVAVLPAADGGSLPDISAELAAADLAAPELVAAEFAAADITAADLAAADLAAVDLAGRIEDEARKFMEMM